MKVSFDIGGVLSKYPQVFRPLAQTLIAGGAEVHVITDMHDKDRVLLMLAENGFDFIPSERVHCADYGTHGEHCKAVIIRELGIDLHMDDFPGYCASGGLQVLVWPNPNEPYWHDDWKTRPEDGVFGRRIHNKRSEG